MLVVMAALAVWLDKAETEARAALLGRAAHRACASRIRTNARRIRKGCVRMAIWRHVSEKWITVHCATAADVIRMADVLIVYPAIYPNAWPDVRA